MSKYCEYVSNLRRTLGTEKGSRSRSRPLLVPLSFASFLILAPPSETLLAIRVWGMTPTERSPSGWALEPQQEVKRRKEVREVSRIDYWYLAAPPGVEERLTAAYSAIATIRMLVVEGFQTRASRIIVGYQATSKSCCRNSPKQDLLNSAILRVLDYWL